MTWLGNCGPDVARIAIYWHTVRYLKPIQIYGRLLHRLPRRTRVAGLTPALEPSSGPWADPAAHLQSNLAPGTFRFLNEVKTLGWPIDWRAEEASLLWRYNLHYFNSLAASDASQCSGYHADLIESWIVNNPIGVKPGWESYPTSLRIVNWIKWSLAGEKLTVSAVQSLAQQARWLSRRLEWHLLGNHLFANAKALVFAGCYFVGAQAERWLEAGATILASELDEQVLSDGGNFELSPMYHAIFLSDLLDLANLARRFPGKIAPALEERLRDKAQAMLGWLDVMVHPDGQIAMFNDGAFGISPTLGELTDYAERLNIQFDRTESAGEEPAIRLLGPSGYGRLETPGAVVLCDVAPVGPDYLPGHAHADTLSFELSIAARRYIVNGGTSRYGADVARECERGTAAHSTVVVNGSNSSEVWSGFRVARRACPTIVRCLVEGGAAILEASHDGYRRLSPAIIHRRNWCLRVGSLLVEDLVSGPWGRAEAQFLLHHEVDVCELVPGTWRLTHLRLTGAEVVLRVLRGTARVEPAFHSLEFGKRLATHAIKVDLDRTGSKVEIAWRAAA